MKFKKTIGVWLSCVLVLSSPNVSYAATMGNLADTDVDEIVSASAVEVAKSDNGVFASSDEETRVIYAVEGGNIYFDKSTGTVSSCDKSITSAVIPSEIDGVDVLSIGTGAFRDCKALESVVIPDGVKNIYGYAFNGCSNLTYVEIPNTVTNIGEYAFYYCNSLTDVTIPDGVECIWESTFQGCSNLVSAELPDSIIQIGQCAFMHCKSLVNIAVPSGVTLLGESAFDGCCSLTEITIPSNITRIDDFMFSNCRSLKGITIPDNIYTIGLGAFEGCDSLTNVTMPANVQTIKDYAFSDCNSLREFIVDDNNAYYTSIDGALYNKDATVLKCVPGGKTGELYVPDTVTSLELAFVGRTNLTGINVDANNSDYASVDGVLYNKSLNTLIRYPGGKTGEFIVPDTVTDVEPSAFSGCSGLTSVTIPNSVTNILSISFTCEGLESINVYDDNADYATVDGVLYDKALTTLLRYPGGKTGELDIPDTVTTIGYSAFSGCKNVTNVKIPYGVTTIESFAFSGCRNLTSITIPKSVNSISLYTFLINDSFTILCNAGSYAETFAKENNISYEILEEACIYGDANNDGSVMAEDAAILLQKVLDNDYVMPAELTEGWLRVLDVDCSGAITSNDAAIVLKKSLDNSFEMECEK